jgi:hypothetical protein
MFGREEETAEGGDENWNPVHYSVRRRSVSDRKDEPSIWMTPGQEQRGLR